MKSRVVGHLVCVALEGVEDERFILSNYRTPAGHFEEKSMFWNSRKKRGLVQQIEQA